MNKPLSVPARRDLRQRMIEDMNVRSFSAKTQHDYLRIVSRFAAFLGRSPDLAPGRHSSVPNRAARGGDAGAGDEQPCCGLAVLLHHDDRPSRSVTQAAPRFLPLQ